MYKQDLTLYNLQGLICYKTQPTIQPKTMNTLYTKKCKVNVVWK